MNKPHKHCEIIKAWADGKTVQHFSHSANKWIDSNTPSFFEDYQYRVKPEALKYRNFLWKSRSNVLHVCATEYKENSRESREEWFGFIRWIGDWQEVEV